MDSPHPFIQAIPFTLYFMKPSILCTMLGLQKHGGLDSGFFLEVRKKLRGIKKGT
jgi:hypothetical protein